VTGCDAARRVLTPYVDGELVGDERRAVDDHLASTLDAPTNIAWVGAGLDRVVVSNVGGTTLSIADVGVAGHPLHLPEVP